MSKLVFFVLSLFLIFYSWSQDKEYISTEYKDGLTVRLQTAAEQVRMEFRTLADTSLSVLYQPNNLSKSGVKLAYNGIGLAIMKRSANYGKNPDLYGKTDQVGLKFSINRRKWGLDINFQRLNGFYIENPGVFLEPNVAGLNPMKRQDVLSRNLMISAIQIFNPERFSYRMQTNQNEIQLKNAGSFLLKYNLVSNRLSGDTTFIPSTYEPYFRSLKKFNNGRFTSIIIQPGYTHTYVLKKKLSLSFKALLGWGIQGSRLETENNAFTNSIGIGTKFDFGISIMYFRPKFFMGLSTDLELVSSRIKKERYNVQNTETLFFIGHRFKRVKILPKFFDRLEKRTVNKSLH